MKISDIVIFIMIVSGIATGLSIFYAELAGTYGVPITENQSLSIIDRTNNITSFTGNVTTTIEGGGGLLESVYFSIGLIWGVIAQMLLLPIILISMINDLFSFVPFVPGWFFTMILSIPVAYIIFRIIEWFTQRET